MWALALGIPALPLGGYLGLMVFHNARDELFRRMTPMLFLVSGLLLWM